ncbi:MAG: T9SS type A sorting domain-containing protein [Ignavibacteria bacterium]|nr:T9SS type A sorting domain-containing protein [Ignavibacteria bacterium]
MRPRNPTVDNNVLRLACNSISADKSSLPVISSKSGGLLIARMRLQTTAESFSVEDLQLKWITGESQFRTKVFAFSDGKNVDITADCDFETEDGSGIASSDNLSELPTSYDLAQNFPNPFNPSTIIRYSLPEQAFVALKVYDISGREVKTLVDEMKSAGTYEVSFNSSGLSSGMYFYRINAGSFSKVMKMVLVK